MWSCVLRLYAIYYSTAGIQSFSKTKADICPMCSLGNAINISCHTYTCQTSSIHKGFSIDNIFVPTVPSNGPQLLNDTSRVYVHCGSNQTTGTIIVLIPDYCENNNTVISCGCTLDPDNSDCLSDSTEPLHVAG